MASAQKTAKKSSKNVRGRGRPATDIEWRGIGVRFTLAEKADLAKVAKAASMSQAEFIRRATLKELQAVKAAGKVELSVDLS